MEKNAAVDPAEKEAAPDGSRVPVGVRMAPHLREQARFWYKRRGFSSVNEYIVHALEEQIGRENGDYSLPTLEIARLNELVDAQRSLTQVVANLQTVVMSGFESFTGLIRGDSYLEDMETGDLDVKL